MLEHSISCIKKIFFKERKAHLVVLERTGGRDCEKEPVQLLLGGAERDAEGKTDRKRPAWGAVLTSCLVSLEDLELRLVQNWPPFWSGLTSRSQHCSQSLDASTILRHLLTKGQNTGGCLTLYVQSKDGVCAHTCMHTRVTTCAKPKGQSERKSLRRAFAVDATSGACLWKGTFLHPSQKYKWIFSEGIHFYSPSPTALNPLSYRINMYSSTCVYVAGLEPLPGRTPTHSCLHVPGWAHACFHPSLDSVGIQPRKAAGFSAIIYKFHNVCVS